MGASRSPAAPPPDAVAAQFTDVYYGVASVQPERLPELFGPDSELSHVAGVCVAAKDIPSSALGLPLAKKERASISSLDAMHTASGGYVVLVTGSLESLPFTQTFVLACAGDVESKAHFYCRNDIFRFVNVPGGTAGGKAVPPSKTPSGIAVEKIEQVASTGSADSAPSALSKMKNGDTGSPASISDITSNNVGIDAPIGEGGQVNGNDAARNEDDEDDEGDEDEDPEDDDAYDDEIPDGTVVENGNVGAGSVKTGTTNGGIQGEITVSAAAESTSVAAKPSYVSPSKEAPATAPSKPATETSVPAAEAVRTVDAPKPSAPSKPPAPKSWASIVSASSGTPAVVPVAAPVAPPATTGSAQSVASEQGNTKASNVMPSSASTAASVHGSSTQKKETSGNMNSYGGSMTANHAGAKSDSNSQSTGNSNTGGWSSVDNKRHGHNSNDGGFKTVNGHHGGYHHQKHNQGRVYGPSAVIQLASVPSERVSKDVRALANDFTSEFAQYGQVRNVEVKVHKGLAFVEYSSADGVRAAVAAWADGARNSGPFKGVALAVSEKRQRRHIPGGDHARGGGRGAVRGGGRGGNGGRGRGRGMPLASGGSGPQSSSSAPTPPSS